MVESTEAAENSEKPMDFSETAAAPTLTLEILKIIKDAQQQHGLRHSDFQRYRGYCTRRIRRLRKVVHLPQGDKRHFKRRDVTEEKVKDERFLMIPLMLCERLWSHAMQLRLEANTEPRKRFHLVQKLRKATVYALQLQKLCESDKCDARTKLEAQAYVAWIHGSLHFELQMWKPAMENFNKSKVVYEKLQCALSDEEQAVYKQRCDELAPSLRYCAYNIGDQTAMGDLLSLRSQAHGQLLDDLDVLMAQAREQRTEGGGEVEWRGRSVQVRPERVRIFLSADRTLDADISDLTSNDRLERLERHLMDCKDALSAAKDELNNDLASKSRTGGPPSPQQHLVSYLTYIRLTRSIQRTKLMADVAKAALTDKSDVGANAVEGRKTRPQDLTRLYEMILQNLVELQQLPGLEDDQEFQQDIAAQTQAYRAFRCFYIAEVLSGLRRWREAGAMYERAEQYARSAQAQVPALREALLRLIEEVDGARYSSLAYAVLEVDSDGTSAAADKITSKSKKKIPLIERLDDYREDAALASRQPLIVKLPPEMTPVPCKPLYFDLALNHVQFPDLDDKLEGAKKNPAPAGLTGFVKGLWGWGGSNAN